MFDNEFSSSSPFGKLEPEYQESFAAYQADPSPKHATRLLNQLKPVISGGVRAYAGESNPLAESRARRLALKAVKSYDPSRARLSTHVYNNLQSLRRHSRELSSGVRFPERIALDHARLIDAELRLKDELDRDPTITELADYTRLSVSRIAKVRSFRPAAAASSFGGAEGEDAWSPAVQQADSLAWMRVAHSELAPADQKILEWTVGLYGAPRLSNEQIAAKLRLTPGAISQRKAKIQRVLDQVREVY